MCTFQKGRNDHDTRYELSPPSDNKRAREVRKRAQAREGKRTLTALVIYIAVTQHMVIYNIYLHLLSQPPNPSPPFKSSSHVPIHTFGVSGSSAFRFAAPPPSMMFCADLFLPPKKRYGILQLSDKLLVKDYLGECIRAHRGSLQVHFDVTDAAIASNMVKCEHTFLAGVVRILQKVFLISRRE